MPVSPKLDFPPSFYARFPVVELSKQDLDKALAAGYYRNGNEICAGSIRNMGPNWVSSIMLRLPIPGFEFKKRHRKILRNNNRIFTTSIQPFAPSAEKEALWQKFKSTVHQWNLIPSFEQHLLRGRPASSYQMWELSVYDGKKLVALTAFDMGKNSLASLEAAYDPDYKSHSLGFYTMLLEIQHCQQESIQHYYPGFLPKDDPMFNYKLRPGEMEFFRLKTKEWLPFSELQEADWLMEQVLERLNPLKQLLTDAGFNVIDAGSYCIHIPSKKPQLTASNLHLIVPIVANGRIHHLFVTWDPIEDGYRVFEGQGLVPELTNQPKAFHFFIQVSQVTYFGQFSNMEDVLLLASEFGQYAKGGSK